MPGHERGEFWPPEKSAPSLDLRARAATQATIAVAIVLLAVWVARDFLVALTWAAVIAITCWPIYLRFEQLVGHRSRSLAPLLFTLVTGLVLLVPIIVTVHQLAQGSEAFVRSINRLRESGIAVPAWLAQLPVVGLLAPRGAAAFNGGAVAFLPLAEAQRFFLKAGQVNSMQLILYDAADRVSRDPAWRYIEMAAGHAIPWTHPQELADILLQLQERAAV